MKRGAIVLCMLSFAAGTLCGAGEPGITFIGRGEIPGNLADKSNVAGSICQSSWSSRSVISALQSDSFEDSCVARAPNGCGSLPTN